MSQNLSHPGTLDSFLINIKRSDLRLPVLMIRASNGFSQKQLHEKARFNFSNCYGTETACQAREEARLS